MQKKLPFLGHLRALNAYYVVENYPIVLGPNESHQRDKKTVTLSVIRPCLLMNSNAMLFYYYYLLVVKNVKIRWNYYGKKIVETFTRTLVVMKNMNGKSGPNLYKKVILCLLQPQMLVETPTTILKFLNNYILGV